MFALLSLLVLFFLVFQRFDVALVMSVVSSIVVNFPVRSVVCGLLPLLLAVMYVCFLFGC